MGTIWTLKLADTAILKVGFCAALRIRTENYVDIIIIIIIIIILIIIL